MKTVRIQGQSIAYDDLGEGKAVVFVHGACETSLFWNHQKILSDRLRIITLDLPGHGESEAPSDLRKISIRYYSDIVSEFVGKICPDKPFIAGSSMGGAIALTSIIYHKEDFRGAVLVGTGAKLGVLPSIREGIRTKFDDTVKLVIGPRQFSSKTSLETIRFVTDEILKCDNRIASADYEACNEFDVRQKLQTISLPTLIMVGEEDKMTPVTWSVYLKENIPKARMIVLTDSSHVPMLERPADFNRHLVEFVTSV